MPSINLLPEDFATETNKHRERIAVYILAAVFLLSSALSYVFVRGEKDLVAANIEKIDGEVVDVKKNIEDSMKAGDLISSDYDKEDIEKLLGEHLYFSEGLDFMKTLIIKDVYLDNLEISPYSDGKNLEFVFTLNTNNSAKLSDQVASIKDSFWVKSLNFSSSVSKDDSKDEDEETLYTADVTMLVDKELFVYHDQYWDYGIEKLIECVDRRIDITSYSVTLNKAEKEGEKDSVTVKFEGTAYGSDAVESFEEKLKSMVDDPKNFDSRKFESPEGIPGVFSLRGSIALDY